MGKEIPATNDRAADFEPASSGSSAAVRRWWYNMFPAVAWLRGYQPKWLRADLIAGVTLAAYLMPAGLADASLLICRHKPAFTPASSPGLFSGCFAARDTQLLRSRPLSQCLWERRSAIWLEAILHDSGLWHRARR